MAPRTRPDLAGTPQVQPNAPTDAEVAPARPWPQVVHVMLWGERVRTARHLPDRSVVVEESWSRDKEWGREADLNPLNQGFRLSVLGVLYMVHGFEFADDDHEAWASLLLGLAVRRAQEWVGIGAKVLISPRDWLALEGVGAQEIAPIEGLNCDESMARVNAHRETLIALHAAVVEHEHYELALKALRRKNKLAVSDDAISAVEDNLKAARKALHDWLGTESADSPTPCATDADAVEHVATVIAIRDEVTGRIAASDRRRRLDAIGLIYGSDGTNETGTVIFERIRKQARAQRVSRATQKRQTLGRHGGLPP